ncbi:MAG: hypothetical protein FWG50_13425 [Kiritimatiellaeota bacterium]|nr:hypothetical protein [Kiritimatiellota bacterium]
MKRMITIVVPLTLMLQCAGCMQYAMWRRDCRNNDQKKRYATSLKEKAMQPMQMVSLYDVHIEPRGKLIWNTAGTARWVTLCADGSFLMLAENWDDFCWRRDLTFVSGLWEREEGASVVLKRQEGTNLVDYASADLTSPANFQAVKWPPGSPIPHRMLKPKKREERVP